MISTNEAYAKDDINVQECSDTNNILRRLLEDEYSLAYCRETFTPLPEKEEMIISDRIYGTLTTFNGLEMRIQLLSHNLPKGDKVLQVNTVLITGRLAERVDRIAQVIRQFYLKNEYTYCNGSSD